MKVHANGAESFLFGMTDAGFDRILVFDNSRWTKEISRTVLTDNILEIHCNAGILLNHAILYSDDGLRVGCIVSQKDIFAVTGLFRYYEYIKAGLVIFILEDESTFNIVSFAVSQRYDLWMCPNVSGIYRLADQVLDYSEIRRKPSLLFIRTGLLMSYGKIDRVKKVKHINLFDNTSKGRSRRLENIDSHYNISVGNGVHAVLCLGELFENVNTICGKCSSVKIISVTHCSPVPVKFIEKETAGCRRLLLIESSRYRISEYFRYMHPAVLEIEDDLQSGEKIYRAIYRMIPAEDRRNLKDVSPPEERTGFRMPAGRQANNILCPGCSIRTELVKKLEENKTERLVFSFYCEKLKAYMESGITSERVLEIHEDQPESGYAGRDCVKISGRIPVIKGSCDGCGECIVHTGCPAIIKNSIKAFIDSSCTGCGLCVKYCGKGAIEQWIQ